MQYRLFVSGYTDDSTQEGVVIAIFDGNRLRKTGGLKGLRNPSYIQPGDGKIYIVEETRETAKISCAAYQIDGRLDLLWRRTVPGSGLCHVASAGSYLFAAGYSGGTLTGVHKDSGEKVFFREFYGHGPNLQRQEKAHIHSALLSPDGTRIIAADLGTDRLYQFILEESGTLREDNPFWFQVAGGTGPRHFAFHPNGKWVYLVGELDLSLTVLLYEEHQLKQVGKYSLGVKGGDESLLAADVHVTADGEFVYTSVRGLDVIHGFHVREDSGVLEPIGSTPSGGKCPRSIAISPDDRYVAVANQLSNEIIVFQRDLKSGEIIRDVCHMCFPQVSCVKWEYEENRRAVHSV